MTDHEEWYDWVRSMNVTVRDRMWHDYRQVRTGFLDQVGSLAIVFGFGMLKPSKAMSNAIIRATI